MTSFFFLRGARWPVLSEFSVSQVQRVAFAGHARRSAAGWRRADTICGAPRRCNRRPVVDYFNVVVFICKPKMAQKDHDQEVRCNGSTHCEFK